MDNDNISKELLSIIDANASMLDTAGLYPFCNQVIAEGKNSAVGDIFCTLSEFLARLYDDDANAIIDDLFDSGFRKWDGLDEYNKFRANISDVKWSNEQILDIGAMYRNFVNNSYYRKYIPKSLLGIDIPSVLEREDYYTLSFVSFMEDYYPRHLDKPFIDCHEVVYGIKPDLYIAVGTTKSKYNLTGVHKVLTMSGKPKENAFYDTAKNVADRYFKKTGMRISYHASTALPLEIVEKYNLPIYEGK